MSTATVDAVWQEVECGGYSADLPFYERLASEAAGPLLDIGAGVGRVALHLASRGHAVTALDSDAGLLAVLEARAAARRLSVQTHCADAREPSLLVAGYSLVLAPMQLVQLLGPEERRTALRGWAELLQPGGKAAIAIVDGQPPNASAGEDDPLPDVLERDGWVYSSLPGSVRTTTEQIVVERVRQAVSPAGELTESRSTDRLDVVTAAEIEAEAEMAGLRPIERIALPDTEDHIGSTVIVLEASHAC